MAVVAVESVAELKSKLSDSDKRIVLVDFSATWCAPCRMIHPLLEQLASENKDILFLNIDIDSEDEVGDLYNIASLPTFIIFKDGEAVNRFSGANIKKVEEMIQKCRSSLN